MYYTTPYANYYDALSPLLIETEICDDVDSKFVQHCYKWCSLHAFSSLRLLTSPSFLGVCGIDVLFCFGFG